MRERRRRAVRARALILAGTTSLLACAARAPATDPPALPAPCRIDTGSPVDSVRVALAHAVTPAAAPLARTSDERFILAQLYETLVRIGCDGVPAGALATSWSASPDGRTWTITLRDGASFWDGAPITALAVAESWAAAPHAALAWVSVAGERQLRIGLHASAADPSFLADPALTVVRRDSAAAWPIGTGPYQPDPDAAQGLRLVLRDPTVRAPRVLRVLPHPGADLRGALDAGADALVARAADVVAYAHALPAYTALPLPWNRTYVLAVTQPPADSALVAPPADALTSLARDAAAAGTRAAAPFTPCADTTGRRPASRTGAPAAAFAYLRGDDIARAIAERLAALAWPPVRTPPWLRARLPAAWNGPAPGTAALDERPFAEALRARRYTGFVIGVPRTAPCSATLVHADAVQRALGDAGLPVTPLVDARDHFVYRRGLGTVLVDSDGTLRLGTERP